MTKTAAPHRIGIVADTNAGLPAGFAAQHGIEVASQAIMLGDHLFLEGEEISYDEFIHEMKSSAQPPKTLAPMPREYIKAYTRQLAGAQTVLSLHPSGDVSGNVRSARLAKHLSFPDADIRILDTRTAAGNLATLIILAAGWAENCVGADEIVNRLKAMIPRGRMYFLVPTSEYLYRGERIGRVEALVNRVLRIEPLLELKGGRLTPFDKIRGRPRALERLKDLVIAQCPHSPEAHLCVMHAADHEAAGRLADDLKTALELDSIPIYNLGASITIHTGPGTLGVGFFAAEGIHS